MHVRDIVVTFADEVRYSVRHWRRGPVFLIGVAGTLGIGLGATALMSSVLDSLLLQGPASVASPASVGRIFMQYDGAANASSLSPVSNYPTLEDLRRSHAFKSVTGSTVRSLAVRRASESMPATVAMVTDDFFTVMGTKAVIGRMFSAGHDGGMTGAAEAVLAMDFWRTNFGADTTVVGRPLVIGGRSYVVVGIAPRGFAGLETRKVDAWVQLGGVDPETLVTDWRTNRHSFWLALSVRLERGVSRAVSGRRATAALRASLRAQGIGDTAVSVVVESPVAGRGPFRPPEVQVALWIGAVAVLLTLLAGANAGALILARSLNDRDDIAVRVALGARASHLARRMVVDALTLAVVAGAVAALVGVVGRPVVEQMLLPGFNWPGGLPDAKTGIGVACLTVGLCLIIQYVAFRAGMRTDIAEALRRVGMSGRKAARSQSVMLGFEAAATSILVVGALAFAFSLRRAEALDVGVDLDHTVLVTFSDQRGLPGRQVATAYEDLARQLVAIHDVDHVVLAEANPYMTGRAIGPSTASKSWESLWGHREAAYVTAVGPGFFTTVGARLQGRDFTVEDRLGAQRVAVIDQPLANYLWPGERALGRTFYDDDGHAVKVVAVLSGVWKFHLLDRNQMMVYVPLAQDTAHPPAALFAHVVGDPARSQREIFSAAYGSGLHFGLPRVAAMRSEADPTYRPWRIGATMFSLFGLVAVLVAIGGMYSLVTYATLERRKEIAIRASLGARFHQIAWLLAGRNLMAVVCGAVIGVAVITLVVRVMGHVFYQTSPLEPVLLLSTLVFVGGAAAVSGIMAVWRTTRDPLMEVLREG